MKEKPPESGKSWKVAIAALIGIFLIGMTVSLVVASRRVSRVVDRDYYQHGLHYGDSQQTTKK
jgi:hypothetical protein